VVEFGDIGFNVQKRSSIEDVHVLNVQSVSSDLDKTDDGEPDRIGPLWGSCGKDASWLGIKERSNNKLVPAALMKVVKKNQMGETVKVL
jgi:hypothetical protein